MIATSRESVTLWAATRSMLEMIRFSHTVFALPFALLAAVAAWNLVPASAAPVEFSLRQLAGILVCMVTARSAAMAFNRVVDRHVDAANPRTKGRHLPAGRIGLSTAVVFTGITAVAFVAATTLFLPNWLPLVLAVPVLVFLFGYSYTKRFTSLAHYWLGIALMLAPICVWIALRGTIVIAAPVDVLPAVVLGLAVMFWVGGFDIIYACQDADFDRESGLQSIPARWGVAKALRWAAVSHAIAVVALCLVPAAVQWAGMSAELGIVWYGGVAAVALLLIYEHALVRPHDLERVNTAFFHVNAIISFSLWIVGTVDILWL